MTDTQWRELRDDESPQKGDQARFENGDVLTVTIVDSVPMWRNTVLDLLPGVRFFREVPERTLPTTDEVRFAFVDRMGFTTQLANGIVNDEQAGELFDAWLAAVQRDAGAKGWDRCWSSEFVSAPTGNPYRGGDR